MNELLLLAQLTGTMQCIGWDRDQKCVFYGNNIIVTTTTTPMPKCDDGWTLVTFPGTNISMCAKELKPANQ
jgi:hypothetical protein